MRSACILLFLLIALEARAQSPIDWEQAYADALTSEEPVTVVDFGAEPAPYPLLLLPDSIRVEGELDELARKILDFRYRHPAIASGEHTPLVNSSYSFQRVLNASPSIDAVVVVVGAEGRTTVNLSRAFPDDAYLQDAMTGRTAFVSFGLATFEADASGILLIEEMK